MTPAAYRDVQVQAEGGSLQVRMNLENRSGKAWSPQNFSIGWQFIDPETNSFIQDGAWTPVESEVPPGAAAAFQIVIPFPPEPAGYRVYVSTVEERSGWGYNRGEPFLLISAEIAGGQVHVLEHRIATRNQLRWQRFRKALPKFFVAPVRSLVRHRALIGSMARRDILARYRGSFGDFFWSILNPLLMMAMYIFVFGIVLRTRFGSDQSSTSFALYLIAGMLPWLAFSEPAGRAPYVIAEHRNFVKKLIFPLETLPVNQVLAGLITELLAAILFLLILLGIRHSIPATAAWLPVLLVPQLLFTLGVCWFLAALGVFVRDLGQIMTFILPLWFFLTPICYPEQSLPAAALVILRKNPLFVLVRAYRAVLLEHHAPELFPMLKLWAVAILVFLLGHAWFYRLRKSFADML